MLVFETSIPDTLLNYTLDYTIPKSDVTLPNQIELEYRTVDSNFPYLQLVKELIYKAAGEPEEIKELLFSTPDVIVQELKHNKILDWHHDAYTFDDGSKLQFEALLYVSNVPEPNRQFYWKEREGVSFNAIHQRISNGTVIFIDCSSDKFVHSAYGSHDSSEKIITLLLGCR